MRRWRWRDVVADRNRPRRGDELVPADDAVIGRAFRWSLLAIAVVAVVAFSAWTLTRQGPADDEVLAKEIETIPDLDRPIAEAPEVRFTDVTEEAGIDFFHHTGARGEKLLPETMGSGVAFLDYDGDLDQDLLFVNSTSWPGDPGPTPPPTQALYRNDGAGRFDDVTREAGLDVELYGVGVAVADYDADGDDDVFLTALGPNRLFRNDGGRFEEVTATSGVAGADDEWSAGAGFFDYDNDGDLDLFVCNYIRWSKEIDLELNFTLNGRDRAYGPPTHYEGTYPYLYRNDGNGRFTDVSDEAGVRVDNPLTGAPMAKSLAAHFADVDGDGFIDILVANDTVQNSLFHNRGDGRFEEIGASSGLGFDSAGNATGAMGIDAGLYRNDSQLAVGIANFANEMSSLYVAQRGGLQFSDESMGEGVGAPSRLHLSFGLFFFDYDLDGRLDLLQANGHLEDEINRFQASQHYEQAVQLFWNAGPDARACFVEVGPESAGDLARPIVGRGAAYGDLDGDGDLDVVLTQAGGRPLVLRNDQDLGNHWLRVRLIGEGPNRNAIGAWIEVEAGGITQRRHVMPTRSYLSQMEMPVTFGLGDATEIDALRIVWPDGTVQDVGPVEIDRTVEIRP
jgi:hypothetical protein